MGARLSREHKGASSPCLQAGVLAQQKGKEVPR
jgi:hypothetical protein